MNISQHLQKEFWKRRIVGDATPKPPTNAQYYIQPTPEAFGDNFRLLTQSDFLNEIEPSAHDINGRYQSTRPIKEAQIKVDAEGNPILGPDGKPMVDWIVVGYDDLETMRVGMQKRIALTKAAHFAGDGWTLNNEQTDKSEDAHKRFDNLNSWRDMAGLDSAFMEIALSCFQTGDCGVYLYATPQGQIDYKIYSYLENYQIFPDIDENRENIYYVLYSLKGKPAVDIFSQTFIETWVQADPKSKDDKSPNSWWAKVKNWFSSKDFTLSEDGWLRVSHKPCQIAFGQFVYFRIPDIPSGVAEQDICALERTASFVCEGVKATTFDTLFIKATNIESLPPIGSHGSVLAVKGDVEELRSSDAKRLAPSDVSNVATIALKELKDSILHSTMSVIVEPELLRSGADSSSAMRLCFNDEVKSCMTLQPHFYKPMKELVEILKYLVAKIEEEPTYTKLRTSVTMNIWVPANFSEQVDNICKLKYADILSAENSRHELDINYPDDMSIVAKEQDDKIYRETYIKLKAEAEARDEFGLEPTANDIVVDKTTNKTNNPTKPPVDNKAKS